MESACLSLLLGVLLLISTTSPTRALELVQLSSANFEHETQAAGGQTSGHWCVLFINRVEDGERSEGAEMAWDTLASDVEEMEYPAVFAKVDIAENPDLARRFSIKETPAVILFRDRLMFRLPSPLPEDDEGTAHLAMDFLAGGWEETDGETVPPEAAGRSGQGGAGAQGKSSGAGAGADGSVSEGVAALVKQLLSVLGETEAVARTAGAAAGVIGIIIVALACFIGINLNFTANPPEAAPAGGNQAPQKEQPQTGGDKAEQQQGGDEKKAAKSEKAKQAASEKDK